MRSSSAQRGRFEMTFIPRVSVCAFPPNFAANASVQGCIRLLKDAPTMVTVSNPVRLPANWQFETRQYGIRVALLLNVLTICLGSYYFENSPAVQHDRTTLGRALPAWVNYLELAFLLLPHAAAFILLHSHRRRLVAAGAGIAAAFSGISLLLSPFMLMSMFLLIGLSGVSHHPDPGFLHLGACLLVFLALGIWIFVTGLLIAKIEWSVFFVAGFVTFLYLSAGFPRLRMINYREEQKAERKHEQSFEKTLEPAGLARQRILSLTDCLLQAHMVDPNAPFPDSLSDFPQGPGCASAPAEDKIPGYTFSYEPHPDTSGKIADFRLTAVPKARGMQSRNPLMTDRTGIVFVDYPWEVNSVPKIIVIPSDRFYAQIDHVKSNIEVYISKNGLTAAPASLTEEMILPQGQSPTLEDGGTRITTMWYDMRYLPAKTGDPKNFALSAQCKRYGQSCLRSFFMDYSGNVYGTGEPREATVKDPLSPKCEEVQTLECTDIFWMP